MLSYLQYLELPEKIALCLAVLFFVVQIVGELLEFKGRVVPEFIKIRKIFIRKHRERKEKAETWKHVQTLLSDVGTRYSADNIAKRDSWMQWVNNRAEIYDESIDNFTTALAGITEALNNNTKMTEKMFVEKSRDRIIDFATKVSDEMTPVSREEFNRIFKTYNEYETFLEERKMTNGEVDVAHRIIQEAYEIHMKNHTFIEDIKGYNN